MTIYYGDYDDSELAGGYEDLTEDLLLDDRDADQLREDIEDLRDQL